MLNQSVVALGHQGDDVARRRELPIQGFAGLSLVALGVRRCRMRVWRGSATCDTI
jgi:hypothetical protein